jgi:hypothetical protein
MDPFSFPSFECCLLPHWLNLEGAQIRERSLNIVVRWKGNLPKTAIERSLSSRLAES